MLFQTHLITEINQSIPDVRGFQEAVTVSQHASVKKQSLLSLSSQVADGG
jgi:hypothetical protein